MFQVASHPTSFAAHHHHARPVPSPTVQLPRSLARPPFLEVSHEAIMAVAPELANVPAEYVRRGLRPKANQYVHLSLQFISMTHSLTRFFCLYRMLAGIAALSMPTSMSKSQIPPSLSIPMFLTLIHGITRRTCRLSINRSDEFFLWRRESGNFPGSCC